jgi:hypothetical protein
LGKVIGKPPGIALVVGQLEIDRCLHSYLNRTGPASNSDDLHVYLTGLRLI